MDVFPQGGYRTWFKFRITKTFRRHLETLVEMHIAQRQRQGRPGELITWDRG